MDHIKLNQDETHELLRCLMRADELTKSTDNLDVVAMAEAAMDMLIEKWEEDGQWLTRELSGRTSWPKHTLVVC